MTVRVAVPIFRVVCRVGIDRGRSWSVIEELLLFAVTHQSRSVGQLCESSHLPRQIVIAAIARLMRFRLVEVTIETGAPTFRASAFGVKSISHGLPYFPKRYFKWVSFVISKATGEVFATRDVRPRSSSKIKEEQAAGADIRRVVVTGGAPEMTNEANFDRLQRIATQGLDEQVASIDDRTVSVRHDECMMVNVSGRQLQGLPESATATLRTIVERTASLPETNGILKVEYQAERRSDMTEPKWRAFKFNKEDLIIGDEIQEECIKALLASAEGRVVMHSTFLRFEAIESLMDSFRTACRQGATIDIFWGAESDDDTISRNCRAATEIMKVVLSDPDLNGRFRIDLKPTGSHAKLLVVEVRNGEWLSVVSTCNWLYSGFDNVELSLVIREPALIADVATAMQRVIGRRGLADRVANELALLARHLRTLPHGGGTATAALISGTQHEDTVRAASTSSVARFAIGTHRLGGTARPGALIPAELAAQRHDNVTVLYSQTSGAIKSRHARELEQEANKKGVCLLHIDHRPRLHGKFIVWDDNDLVLTSLNWGSATADSDFPWGEVGIHIHAPGVGAFALTRLGQYFPELVND